MQQECERRRQQHDRLDCHRCASLGHPERQQRHHRRDASKLGELHPDHAGDVVHQRHQHLAQPVHQDPVPRTRRAGVRRRRVEEELMLCEDDIAEVEMAPEVGVGAAHRVGQHDREQHHAGRGAQQRAAVRWWRGVRRRLDGMPTRQGSASVPHHLLETPPQALTSARWPGTTPAMTRRAQPAALPLPTVDTLAARAPERQNDTRGSSATEVGAAWLCKEAARGRRELAPPAESRHEQIVAAGTTSG